MKNTAVDWLVDQIENFNCMKLGLIPSDIIEEAKQMEKKQIKESYDAGVWEVGCRNADSDEYYKETYQQ